ncbi:MAG: hypothetical protein VWZ99_04635 [Aquiluna sp.]|jgi:hypothetical protein
MPTTSAALFAKALKFSLLLAAAVAVIGGAIGFLIYGTPGLYSALIGAAVAVVFGAMTILSISIGAKLPLGGFYGMVLGGWLIKLLLFAVLMGLLQSATFISGPMFFFAVVASVLGGLAVDSYLVLSAKLPAVEN